MTTMLIRTVQGTIDTGDQKYGRQLASILERSALVLRARFGGAPIWSTQPLKPLGKPRGGPWQVRALRRVVELLKTGVTEPGAIVSHLDEIGAFDLEQVTHMLNRIDGWKREGRVGVAIKIEGRSYKVRL